MSAEVRHAIVEVRWGPRGFTKAAIAPGETLRVGAVGSRAPRRRLLTLPEDPLMAPSHLELAWDGTNLRLSRLAPQRHSLELNGEAVTKGAAVEHGDWVRAGGTDLLVYVEATRVVSRPAHPGAAAALASLAGSGSLFAVLDAARDPAILELLRESVESHRSLFEGMGGELLEDVAPYAVALPARSALTERLVRAGWGRRWGVFLSFGGSIEQLRRHLRRFLIVRDDETDRRLYFRLYDPQVLRRFLPTCTPGQGARFFGDIEWFLVEGEAGEPLRLGPEHAAFTGEGAA